MSRADLYFIPPQGPQSRLLFACRLLEKAYQQQHQIYVHMEDAAKAQMLDKLLWIFKEESFVPHHVYDASTALTSPVQIGHALAPPTHEDILLNMHTDIPVFHSQFKRILEIWPDEPGMQALADTHRRYYERNGYIITSHQLNK